MKSFSKMQAKRCDNAKDIVNIVKKSLSQHSTSEQIIKIVKNVISFSEAVLEIHRKRMLVRS